MRKVLVIDDEEELREMLRDVLSVAEFHVSTANNGFEGLQKLNEENFDLVLVDCQMPIMNGYELVAKMRADPMLVNKPVIMLTVLSGEQDQIKGLNIGVDDYVTKPFKLPVLLARINSILERSSVSIGTNPLTNLCGNEMIKLEFYKRIPSGVPFTLIYTDLSNFKSFNDHYGFSRGDEVIIHTANILVEAVRTFGKKGDFVGHIGGDDFLILTGVYDHEAICEHIIKTFDESVRKFYNPADLERGYIWSLNRNQEREKFPVITISLVVVSTKYTKLVHFGQLSKIVAELKQEVKKDKRSSYIVERRRD
jgi:diguanylate cyclase (GGDEF)-like protein